MAWVDPKIAAKVAHLPSVRAEVRAERDRIATRARSFFAGHDRPGGHKITTQDDELDAMVSLEGPAPLALEFGHWTPDHKRFVDGIHVLGRAIGQADK